MSLNPTGFGGASWNMTRPNDPDYSLELIGTVVSMQEVQARMYNPNGNGPGAPRFWPDGNPVMNIRVGFAVPDGSLKSITFAKAGKKQVSGEKPSLHMQLFNLTKGNFEELMGKTVHLWTWPQNPNTNQPWGQGNPRLFGCELVEDQHYELNGALPPEYAVPQLLANDGASGGQPAPQVAQPMPPSPQMMQQPPQQAYPQPYQQPQSAPMPQGMDPAIAQRMQQMGAQNVQPVTEDEQLGQLYPDVEF